MTEGEREGEEERDEEREEAGDSQNGLEPSTIAKGSFAHTYSSIKVLRLVDTSAAPLLLAFLVPNILWEITGLACRESRVEG